LKSILSFILLSALAAQATTISGKVTNGTTNKPAAGDQVILIKLSQTMEQETSTKVAADGRYSLEVSDNSVPHLVRVIHDKVMYHQPAPPGTTNADVTVYDALPKLAGVSGNMDVMRMQTDQTGLAVTEMYVLKNNSSPPRTLMSDHSFEIYMPENAALDAAMAAGPGGMPVRSAPAPLADKGHYAFIFPVRPGETRFQVSYHLPYSGSANFAPRVTLPFENVAVELPQSMQFTAADAGSFDKVVDEKGATVQVAKNVAAGKAPAFRISGSGTIPEDALSDGGDAGGGGGNSAAQTNRPGGGIGTPENTPDPLQNYRWYVLGGIALVLAAGAFWMTNRRPLATATGAVAVAALRSSTVASRPLASAPSANRNGLLLEALKEELFQLETERLQNKISAEEYEKAKAALDQTLGRAMRRSSS
jgi:hypothetical protein